MPTSGTLLQNCYRLLRSLGDGVQQDAKRFLDAISGGFAFILGLVVGDLLWTTSALILTLGASILIWSVAPHEQTPRLIGMLASLLVCMLSFQWLAVARQGRAGRMRSPARGAAVALSAVIMLGYSFALDLVFGLIFLLLALAVLVSWELASLHAISLS